MSVHHQYLVLGLILIASFAELVAVIIQRLRSRRSLRVVGGGAVNRGGNISITVSDSGSEVRFLNFSSARGIEGIENVSSAQQFTVGNTEFVAYMRTADQVHLISAKP